MKKWIIIAVLAGLGWAAYHFQFREGGGKEEGKPALEPVAVERGDLRLGVQATGQVEPQNRVVMRPPLAGRVEEILVREGDWVKRGQVLAWLSSNERAALLDAARARGAGELKRWEELYKATPLVAPITGTVIARLTEPGQSVTGSETILVVSDRLIIKAQVDETDISKIKTGQRSRITLDAYSENKIPAKVDHIAFEARQVNQVTIYDVEVLPKEVPRFMRSGMTASVEFEADSRRGVLILPQDAVLSGPSGSYVRLTAPAGTTRTVEVGMNDGARVEIVSGLKEGDMVMAPSTDLPSAPKASSPFQQQRTPRPPRAARGGGGNRR